MFLPKKSTILNKLAEQSGLVQTTAMTFREIAHGRETLTDGCATLEALEREADRKVHEISEDIEGFFILPFDKEDLNELTELLDDRVGNLEQVANRMKIYRIKDTS